MNSKIQRKEPYLIRLLAPLCARILKWLGWIIEGGSTSVSKCIIVAAPHTSNWDLLYTLLCAMAVHVPIWFMMKHTHFWWPAGVLWRTLGGIPIHRSKSSGLVEQMVEAFQKRDVLYLVIAPEGTRKEVPHWKTGFYYIALGANVPLWPWFIDYKTKRIGSGDLIYPTGDIEADFRKIREFFEQKYGPMPHCHPAPKT